jgi:DNA-binding response OmpR family regulator
VATVLVIEDDPDMRDLEHIVLTRDGHKVLLATNGHEGLRALEAARPCVIILDLMMPVMDGLTFLIERQRRNIAADVPVVCVSAGGEAFVRRALQLGARECIGKPTDVEQLCRRVAHYCSGAE